MLERVDDRVAKRRLEEERRMPQVEDDGVDRDRPHRTAQLPECRAQRAPARQRDEDRARQIEEQHRVADANQEQGRRDVRHQHVLGHVRRDVGVRPGVQRPDEREREQGEAGPPERLLPTGYAVATYAEDAQRAHVQRAKHHQPGERPRLERHGA